MRESKKLEFKEKVTKTFLKTVSAFANFGNGTIMFGVDDDGIEQGLDNPEARRLEVENMINDTITPRPKYTLEIKKNKKVLELTVYEGKDKPYLYNGKAYRRSDTSTVEVDQTELRRLILEGKNINYEDLPSEKQDLSFSYLEAKLQKKMGIEQLTSDICKTLGFITKEGEYTNCAELFSDCNTIPGIDIARFGKSISEIKERKNLSGTCILQQYEEAVEWFKREYRYEKIDGIERKVIENIPEVAFREAVANAIVHRTWDENACIRVAMFPDKIEITSPGGLLSGVSEYEYLNGILSVLRNPMIGMVFFRLNLIEMFGTGIRRIREAYDDYSVEPQFIVSEKAVTIILPAVKLLDFELSEEESLVIEILKSNKKMSSSEICGETKMNKSKLIRIINLLVEKNVVKAEGNGRGRRYYLQK